MKGPSERLKYDLRRVWECPVCHHKERADGTVTTLVCRCQAAIDSPDRVVMKLAEDRIQRRLPAFTPPIDAGQPETASSVAPLDEALPPEAESTDESQSEL